MYYWYARNWSEIVVVVFLIAFVIDMIIYRSGENMRSNELFWI
jgi:hypothetical protein